MTSKARLAAAAGILLLTIAGKAVTVLYSAWRGGEDLNVRWEGAVIDLNSRDLGASLNACLEQPLFREHVIQRSNVWFSGWSCANVGKPDVIYSLNYRRERRENYFCTDAGTVNVGRHFNPDITLNNLEFEKTWTNAAMREPACAFFRDSFTEIAAGKKILVHCDAGKDRTGTYAALLAALTAESGGFLNQQVLDAIECDYRKSESLEFHKYGRMRHFIQSLQASGGIAAFFERTCSIEGQTLQQVAARFLALPLKKSDPSH